MATTQFDDSWEDLWAGHDDPESTGAVFTKPEIVDLILDLGGYTVGGPRLAATKVLEPSCGDGAFVARVVDRLIASERIHRDRRGWDSPVLDGALRAADINGDHVLSAQRVIVDRLTSAGCAPSRAKKLAEIWTVRTDFLLYDWRDKFDFVVGNPPYVRVESLPKSVLERYRAQYETMGDRADVYVAFIERGLQLLSPEGRLGFIVANRWSKNMYGRGLRRLIAARYHVRAYVNLEHTQPFLADVSAYPAVVVVDRMRGLPTRAATLTDLEPATLRSVLVGVTVPALDTNSPVSEFPTWYPDGGPWLTTCDEEHGAISRMQGRLPTLEESAPGTRVGIGVATGADRVYVLKQKHEEIEDDRQIPMLMASNIGNDALAWSGRYLLNPFDAVDDGSLVPLGSYPGMAAYLEEHSERLKGRHVAKTRPHSWYRTIDRVWPALQRKPKLVIPDIQPAAASVIGYDRGDYYPHHNVYWITSDTWPLEALKTLLRSTFVLDQVRAHSVQMRGGSVRWQAQVLRQLRIPALLTLSAEVIETLTAMSTSASQDAIDNAAASAFGLGAR